MYRVISCLATEHDPWLLALAVVVCLSTASITFRVYSLAIVSANLRRGGWVVLTGVCAGSGIWATHFVAMLAYDGGYPIAFEPVVTLGSLLVAVTLATAGFALSVSGLAWMPVVGGCVVGASIGFMHYLGARAMMVPGTLLWDVPLVVASWTLGVAIGASAIAAFHWYRQDTSAVVSSASLLVFAICGLHFTSMGAVAVVPDPTVPFQPSELNHPLMAMATAGVTLIVLLTALSATVIQRSNLRCEETLREQNRRFEAALHYLPVGLSMFDAKRQLIMCNRAYREIYNLTVDEAQPGITFDEIMRGRAEYESDATGDDWLLQHATELATGKAFGDTRTLRDGRAISVRVGPITGGGWVDVQEDVTERSQQEAKIAHMAEHDMLTGLPNRAHLNARLASILANLEKTQHVALLFLDLDRFKDVNDTLGHRVGDALLVEVAQRLRGCLRGDDIIARVGGDEFVVMAVSSQPSIDAASIASRILDAINAPYDVSGHKLTIGTSIGIALSDNQQIDGEALLSRADLALYRAKADGRGTFCMFEYEMDTQARRRHEMEQDLRSALELGEFELNYQPLMNLETGGVSAFEALLRWNHPERGLVSPAEFIPVAEDTGMIIPIGEWVLRVACRQAVTWPEHIKVAVNVSPVQFKGEALLQAVIGAIAASGLNPRRLELEITESALLHNSDKTLTVLQRLSDVGVRIVMDDFGTGYSSLSNLRSFPFSKIKIDRCFVSTLTEEGGGLAIVRAICGLGSALGLAITAEGVETQDQLAHLRHEGCTEMQGFLFSTPLPADALKGFLATEGAEPAAA